MGITLALAFSFLTAPWASLTNFAQPNLMKVGLLPLLVHLALSGATRNHRSTLLNLIDL